MLKFSGDGELNVPELYGRDVLALGHRRRNHYLKAAHQYWRLTGFPHIRLVKQDKHTQFRSVANAKLVQPEDGHALCASTVGLSLANSYHPQMWTARSHGHHRCPMEYFEDDLHLHQMLARAPQFWPNKRCWSSQAVRNLVGIYAGGRVANFRPVAAKSLINHFSRDGDVVLDFSAGYGGRLLACLTLDRVYIGIDPARGQIMGLERMQRDFRKLSRSQIEIMRGCAEDILPGIERAAVDLVFSSPPFFNLEIYSNEKTQSSWRYRTYEQWRSHFLEAVIVQSCRLLRRRGYFAINVSSRNRSSHFLQADTLEIASRFFAHHSTIYMKMPARPLQRASDESRYRLEPIYVFQKR
jgi:hypothetical protein